jgi:hypothetical protein
LKLNSRYPKVATKGKVIPFPIVVLPVAEQRQLELDAPAVRKASARAAIPWHVFAWLAAGWWVAADRLCSAVERGQVFDAVDGAAFLLAAIMPLVGLRALLIAWVSRPKPPKEHESDPV